MTGAERPSSEFYITDIGGSRCQVIIAIEKFVTFTHNRLQRAMWVPFFDDGTQTSWLLLSTKSDAPPVQCILFLAPLAFNEYLEEDAKINRLVCIPFSPPPPHNCMTSAFLQEDSLNLWRDICGNKLLAEAQIILFLNKRDVLRATLEAGVQVKKYVLTYGNRPNDIKSVTQCMFVLCFFFRMGLEQKKKKKSLDGSRF